MVIIYGIIRPNSMMDHNSWYIIYGIIRPDSMMDHNLWDHLMGGCEILEHKWCQKIDVRRCSLVHFTRAYFHLLVKIYICMLE